METKEALTAVAEQLGYTEQRTGKDSVVYVRTTAEFPVVVEVYLSTGDAAVYMPHPRQRAYRLFHFGAAWSTESMAEVFRRPWNDLQFAYRMSDVLLHPAESVPTAPPPLSLTNALERQLAIVDREIADLRSERAELKRKLRSLQDTDDESDFLARPRDIERNPRDIERNPRDIDRNSRDMERNSRDMERNSRDMERNSRDMERNSRDVDRPPPRDVDRSSRELDRSSREVARGGELAKKLKNRRHLSSVDEFSGRASSSRAVEDEGGGLDLSQSTMSASTVDRVRGNKAAWNLFAQEEFGRHWSARSVALVALGRGYVVGYDDGAVVWHDICPLLESKLRQQGLTPGSAGAVRVKYLVLGAESNFYVKFDNGRMEWCGQDAFGDTLRRGVNERRLLVDRVAFGQHGSWIVLWSDGSFDSEGLPTTLVDRLRRTRHSPRSTDTRLSGTASGIKDVTVGPTGEWFVIYKDHSVQADNLPDALYKTLSQIREKSGRVRSIVFGENRSWFVRFWDGQK